MSEEDWSELKRLAEALSGREWYVLGPPWVGYTDTFTVLRGSPDPHTGVAILETVPNEEADETDDHYEQEALAKWLQHADPNAVLELIAEVERLRAEPAKKLANEYVDLLISDRQRAYDEVGKFREELTALTAQRDEMAEALGDIRSIAENVQSSYDRNGPQYTFDSGTEVYEASYVLGEMEEIARRARTALNKEKTDGGET